MESKEVAQAIAELLSRKKAKDVVMIDIAEKSSFADFFVIATGTSDRQLGALADDVEDKFAELGIDPKSKDGRRSPCCYIGIKRIMLSFITVSYTIPIRFATN